MSGAPTPDDVYAAWRERRDQGEEVDPESVIRAHPDMAEDLRDRFDAARLLDDLVAAEMSKAPPRRVGEFRIVREIGRGGMGVVYEAVQESIGRHVAVKVLYPSMAPPKDAVARFRREAALAARVRHPNIVPVHTLGQDEGLWYCAMEHVGGPPLSRIIEQMRTVAGPQRRRTPIASTLTGEVSGSDADVRRVASLFAEIADALEAAHHAGVLHRDVKPSNLLLGEDGHLRLADFGLALMAGESRLTRTGDVVGTPLYMGPEHFRGSGIGPASDVYSLGATLYEVLTLRPPHDPQDPARLSAEVLTQDPPRPRSLVPSLPKDFETVVLKAIEKDPGHRYATAGAFAADLRAFAAGEAVAAQPVPPWLRAARKVRRHPARAIAAGLAALGAGTALVLASQASRATEARRDAEYRLLLDRAAAVRPHDGDEDASEVRSLYDQAVALAPDRPEAYVGRAIAAGGAPAARLADVDAAAARGADAGTAALMRALLLEMQGDAARADAALSAAGAAAGADDPLAHLVAARRAARSGDLRAAEGEYARALRELPPSTPLRWPVLTGLLDVHLREERHAQALDDIHALQAAGDDRVKVAALEPWLWRRLGKEEEAATRADALVARVEKTEDAAINVGHVWWTKRAWDWMERLTDRAIRQFPASADLWGLRALAYDGTSRFDEAVAAWDKACAAAPGRGWLEARRARTLINARRYDEAVAASDRAVKAGPEDAEAWQVRAAALARAGRPEEAEAAAHEAARREPESRATVMLLADLLMRAGKHDEAERMLTPLLRDGPGDPEVNLLLALVRVQQKRHAEALEAANLALRAEPGSADILRARGEALEGLGRWRDAEQALRDAVEASPRGVLARVRLGKLYMRLGRWSDAEPVLREVVALAPGSADAWDDLGRALQGKDDRRGALDAYEKALTIDPGSTVYLEDKACVLLEMGRARDSLPLFDDLVARRPDNAVTRFNRAMAYVALRRKEDAITDYGVAARLDPSDPVAHARRGALYAEVGRPDEGVAELRAAAALAPKDLSYRHDLAVILLRVARYEEAEEAARAAIAVKPDDAESQSLVGHLLLLRNRPKEALPYLEEARRLAPGNAGFLQDLAAGYFEVGREGAAADVLADAVKRFPDLAQVRVALAWTLVDSADPAVRDPQLAAIHARRATDLEAGNAVAWMALGAALFRQERYGEAVVRLEKARELDAKRVDPSASYYLAMALERLGRTAEARACFGAAEALRRLLEHDDTGNRRRAKEAAAVLGLPEPR